MQKIITQQLVLTFGLVLIPWLYRKKIFLRV